MDLAQFTVGVQAMILLPAGQKKRSLAVAKALDDALRLEFFRHLEEVHAEMQEVSRAQTAWVEEAEEFVAVTTKEVRHIDLVRNEAKEREANLRRAEAQLFPDAA